MFHRIDGILFNTVSVGEGPATFVAHGGWTGSWEMWLQPFEVMSRRRRCVGFDHRGSGETVAPSETITAERMVDDLVAILDVLEVDRCLLGAESMGCVIAAMAALREPERFQGLVLVSAVPSVTPEATSQLTQGSRVDYPATVRAFVDSCVPEPDSDHLTRWGRNMLGRSDGESAARLFEGAYGFEPDLATISIPTLLIHGTEDRIAPIEGAREMAEIIPGAELEVLEGAGHVPTVTYPEVVADLIESWATRIGVWV